MNCHSEKKENNKKRLKNDTRKINAGNYPISAFSLIEIMAALIILALICSSVLMVYRRSITTAIDSQLRTKAFEIARENMEKLLVSDSVQESVEYGTSDRFPEIEWQTVIETFFEPLTSRMWVQAICSAVYTDSQGQEQTVELTHWLTDLSRQDMLKILQERQQDKFLEWLASQLIETIEDAAVYAGVSIETIEQWVDNGMLTTEDGSFVKENLDLFNETDGNPTEEQIAGQTDPTEQIPPIGPDQSDNQGGEETGGEDDGDGQPNGEEPDYTYVLCGVTYTFDELMAMPFDELFDLVWNCL